VPELPEVETIRRELAPLVVGRHVVTAGSHPSSKFAPVRDLPGATIAAVDRRGKYLLFGLDRDRQMVVHLGMTGVLRSGRTEDPYVRAWWTFGDGTTIEYRDVRRFGRIAVVPDGDHRSLPTLHRLGPEPLSAQFTPDGLWREMRSSSLRVKTQLLNQRVVAGVGNIYADEALWRAGIDPASRRLTRRQAELLHEAICVVLSAGIANGGTTLRDYRTVMGAAGRNQLHLSCYGRAGQPCRRCRTELERRILDGRGTTWCRHCQGR